jgi:hypothetical protein
MDFARSGSTSSRCIAPPSARPHTHRRLRIGEPDGIGELPERSQSALSPADISTHRGHHAFKSHVHDQAVPTTSARDLRSTLHVVAGSAQTFGERDYFGGRPDP